MQSWLILTLGLMAIFLAILVLLTTIGTITRERAAIGAAERKRNLGWRLYKAQQVHGRWAQPYGYPIQLFGPWTRHEGPWRYISERMLRSLNPARGS